MTEEEKSKAQDLLDALLRDAYTQGYNQAIKDLQALRGLHSEPGPTDGPEDQK